MGKMKYGNVIADGVQSYQRAKISVGRNDEANFSPALQTTFVLIFGRCI